MKKSVRIYKRVSTKDQSHDRQNHLIQKAKSSGYYIAGIYEEKASGANPNRPELNRLINDLQDGDIVLAENIDRLSRLPLDKAKELIDRIYAKNATIEVPGFTDLKQFRTGDELSGIVMDGVSRVMLEMLLHFANLNYKDSRKRQAQGIEDAKKRGVYKGRPHSAETHKTILELRALGKSISKTAAIAKCSISLVKTVTKKEKERVAELNAKNKQIDFISDDDKLQ